MVIFVSFSFSVLFSSFSFKWERYHLEGKCPENEIIFGGYFFLTHALLNTLTRISCMGYKIFYTERV